jgi:outer membrane protein TolC
MEMKKLLTVIVMVSASGFASFAQQKDLDYFISAAVANSPLLNDYYNQILSNKIDSQVLIASRKVQVTGNGNSFYAPVIHGYGYDVILTNGGQLQTLVTATKSLIPKRFLSAQFQDVSITGDSLRIASRLYEQDLRRTIINQYLAVFGDQLQLEFTSSLVTLLNNEEIILKKLTRQNIYKQVDYLSFLVTLQQQNLGRQQLASQYKNDYATLNYLSGLFDTTTVAVKPPAMVARQGLGKDSSPFLLKYRIDSLRLINNKSIIDLGYRPRINLFGDGGYQSSFMVAPYKNFGASVGINFIVPIYDGNQKKLQYTKLAIAERTRLRNKEFFESQYRQQVAQLQQQLDAIDSLLEPINSQVKYIETLIAADGKLLETGDIKITDYVLAINNLITARNLVVQNTISRYQVITQLNYWKY